LRPPQTFLLIGIALVLTGVGIVSWEFGSGDDLSGQYQPTAQATAGAGPAPERHSAPVDGGTNVLQGRPETATASAERVERPSRPIEPGTTTGIIDGRIALDTRVLDRLHSYTIEVVEDINENALGSDNSKKPFRKNQRFAYDRVGTPFFTLEGIPFSRHGYVVRVQAAQLNGSQARVHVTREKPCGEVQLGLAPGVIFSILLRDQRQTPRPGLSVQMVPEGDAGDRPVYRGTSNNYGQVLLEDVVQGDYKIYVGHLNAPMNVPEKITVLPVNAIHTNDGHHKVTTQSALVLVPSGAPVTVEVSDRYGYLVADAELEMHQIEVTRYFAYKAKTGPSGRHVFEHLPIGKYQLSVHKPGFGRRTRKLEVKDGDQHRLEKIELSR